MQEYILWYDRPAANWNEALPLGNGFMGAMCFGGTLVDRFQLNLDSLWHGTFRDRINPDAKASIPKIRELLREGRIGEAEDMANETMSGIPEYQSRYVPLGDLFLIPDCGERIQLLGIREHWNPQVTKNEELPGYRRSLDIRTGIHSVSYEKEGISFSRESFISYPDRIMAVNTKGSSYRIMIARSADAGDIKRIDDKTLCMEGIECDEGVRYCFAVRVINGEVTFAGQTMHCSADSLILVAGQTGFYVEDPLSDILSVLDKAEEKGYV